MNKEFRRFCENKIKDFDFHNEIKIKKCKKPITVLLGPNGCGKSLSIISMKAELNKEHINYIEYSTKKNDIVSKSASAFGRWNVYGLSCAFHSEGERMCDSFNDWCNTVMLKELLTNEDDLYIFIDEADSGLSLDRLIETLNVLLVILDLEKEKHPNRIVKFVFTCNSYEMLECLRSDKTLFLWVPTQKEVNFKTYNSFAKKYREYYEMVLKEK